MARPGPSQDTWHEGTALTTLQISSELAGRPAGGQQLETRRNLVQGVRRQQGQARMTGQGLGPRRLGSRKKEQVLHK